MSNTSKAALAAEVVKLCGELGKPVPEDLDALKQLALFDVLEALTGQKDPRRPGAGVVRATQPPAANSPDELKPDELKPDELKPDELKPDEPAASPDLEAPAVDAEKPTRFRVAEGKLVHCLCGPLGAFQEIRAVDLGGGEEELESLFAEGIVVGAKR